jgi:cytochrome c-type biogenesis protein CcsB
VFATVAAVARILTVFAGASTYRVGATNVGSVTIALSANEPAAPAFVGKFATYIALGLMTASIVARTIAVERPPLGNLWEYTLALGFGVMLFTVLFEAGFKDRSIGTVMLPVAVGLMAISLAFFPSEVTPLVPALQANRILGIHVTMMVMSYSALSISFGAAVLYLMQGEGKERRFGRLPDGETLSEVGYWSVLVGFPMLTLGIALGAYWANSAWGRYWGWDPKETAALLTWLVYAGYLHARGLRGWEGNRAAWLLIGAFGAVLFTYFAVNFVFSGLHSYAGV